MKHKILSILIIACSLFFNNCDTQKDSKKKTANDALLSLMAGKILTQALSQMGGSVTFTEDGQQVEMTSTQGFYLSYGNTDYAHYSGDFENDGYYGIGIRLPTSVSGGSVYHGSYCTGYECLSSFSFAYNKKGILYGSEDDNFTLTVTSLSGGRIKATFSGILYPFLGYTNSPTTPITISNGCLSAFIRDTY